MKNLEKIFKTFGYKKRLLIINYLLHEKEATVREIAKKINLSPKAASKHLIRLDQVGILKQRRDGGDSFYSLQNQDDKIIKLLIDLVKNNNDRV